MNQQTYEHARFIIDRYDHYNDSVNNKGAFYITLNTFLLGGLIVGFTSLHKEVIDGSIIWSLLIAFAICSLLSIILTITAINPFLNSGHCKKKKCSLIFFGSVSRLDYTKYKQEFLTQNDTDKNEDMINQAWLLSQGLNYKYRSLRVAGWLLITQFLLLLPILYLITLKLMQK